jgi:hypothetical protein
MVFFPAASRHFLGPTYPFIQLVCWGLTLGGIQPWRKADHSPPSSINIKNEWSLSPPEDVHLSGKKYHNVAKGPE